MPLFVIISIYWGFKSNKLLLRTTFGLQVKLKKDKTNAMLEEDKHQPNVFINGLLLIYKAVYCRSIKHGGSRSLIPPVPLSKCPLARDWTPNCSWFMGKM